MATSITAITDVEAVNRILSTVGGEKVADLTSLSLTADSAYTHLRDSLRDLQSHPWGFNTQTNVELEADGHGRIVFDSSNLVSGGPNDFTTGWVHVNEKGVDGTPGPLGYGHAHHWGEHKDLDTNAYSVYDFSDALGNAMDNDTYYTFSVYMKYHSASVSQIKIWDNSAPTRETEVSININWNTDGSVGSSSTQLTGEEAGVTDGDTTAPPLMAASYEEVGKGWIRMITTIKIAGAHDTDGFYRWEVRPNHLANGSGSAGTAAFGSSYMWGLQLVKSAYVAPFEQGFYGSKFIAAIDLAPENAGNLDVVLRTDESQNALAISDIDPMLFDRTSNSFNAFSGKYKANITYYLSFEDCPEVVKIYATALAAADFQAAQVGNPQIDLILRGKIQAAKAAFESYEATQESWSIFENYDVWKILSPYNRPDIGGGATRSSWASSLG